jgi:molecular chaperone DnaJ
VSGISWEKILKDPYSVLGVPSTATLDEIKKAYRNLAMKYHPDQNQGDTECATKFKEISDAYEILGDENARKQYDTFGSTKGSQGFNPFGGQNKPFSSPLDDFFVSQFFNQKRATKGEHVFVNVELTLEQVYKGAKLELPFTRKSLCNHCQGAGGTRQQCADCNGSGVKIIYGRAATVQTQCRTCGGMGDTIGEPCGQCDHGFGPSQTDTISFDVPAGVETGMRFCQNGLGHPSNKPQGIPGDLFLIITVKPHEIFERSDSGNLILKFPMSYSELILGTEIEVPTLDGLVKVKIPSGTQSNAKFKLKNMGVPVFGRDGNIYGRGDLYVHVKLETPMAVDGRYKEIIEELAVFELARIANARNTLIEKLGVDNEKSHEE